MTLKQTLALAFLASSSVTAGAQDLITFKNGKIIQAKVKEVAPETITYKRWDNQQGPDFVVTKSKVGSIKYENGAIDELNAIEKDQYDGRVRRMGLSNATYGKNIISIAPVQMANEGATGFGLQYERVIEKKNRISVVLPVAVIIYNQFGSSSERVSTFHYFNPGIKFYPTGSDRRVAYAIGASAAFGMGKRWVNESGYWGHEPNSKYLNLFKAGFLINNSINVQPTKHLYLGAELGIGFTYFDQENKYRYYHTFIDEPMVNFSFKIGYRF